MAGLMTVCPICRVAQVNQGSTGRPRKTCGAACAAEYRRLRQFMGRRLADSLKGLLSVAQAVEFMPADIRAKYAGLVDELGATSGAQLVDRRLREGWIKDRLLLE